MVRRGPRHDPGVRRRHRSRRRPARQHARGPQARDDRGRCAARAVLQGSHPDRAPRRVEPPRHPGGGRDDRRSCRASGARCARRQRSRRYAGGGALGALRSRVSSHRGALGRRDRHDRRPSRHRRRRPARSGDRVRATYAGSGDGRCHQRPRIQPRCPSHRVETCLGPWTDDGRTTDRRRRGRAPWRLRLRTRRDQGRHRGHEGRRARHRERVRRGRVATSERRGAVGPGGLLSTRGSGGKASRAASNTP